MIEINVNGSVVSVQKTEALYCGAQDVHTCRFSFDGNWEQYFKTAVFRVNGRAITAVIEEDGSCILPWELLVRDNIGFDIEVGVYGVSADAEILTSVWDSIGTVREGSELGNDAREPSAGVYEQLAAGVKKVDEKIVSYSAEVQTLVQRAESAAAVTEEGIEKAQDSAASAVGAAGAAERALEGVRNALDNIPAGSTVVINDLTTGGTTAALSAEMGTVLAQRPNPNLLHNWYFANPVNQRGQSLYTGTGYTIDRWRNRNNNMETKVADDGLFVQNTSDTSAVFLIQPLEKKLPEGEYTLSILVTELSGDVRLALYNASGGYAKRVVIESPGVYAVTQSISADTAFDNVRIVLMGGAYATVAAVKLERGGEQTLAHWNGSKWVLNEIPDYGEELRKCQRYFQAVDQIEFQANAFEKRYVLMNATATSRTTATATIHLPVPMRTTPAVYWGSFVPSIPWEYLDNQDSYSSKGEDVTAISARGGNGNQGRVNLDITIGAVLAGLELGKQCEVAFEVGSTLLPKSHFFLFLDADL